MELQDVEFSHYSQNGEDGIIAHLAGRLERCSKTFVEIGCGSGKENNTTWLAINGWKGVAIDRKYRRIRDYIDRKFEGVSAHCMDIRPDTIDDKFAMGLPNTVDVFSLDIDSWDMHVMLALLRQGFKPSIAVLEYNASFGPTASISVPYPIKHSIKDLYYGASLQCWHAVMGKYGYEFVTVDSAGVNAFYLRKGEGHFEFEPLTWADNVDAQRRFGTPEERWEKLSKLPYTKVSRISA